MNMDLIYEGGFYSVENNLYEIKIYKKREKESEPTPATETIAFGETPLEIEWSEAEKFEPVQSSHATLTLFSDSDRQFIDLYSIEIGSVRMDVYRNKDLYWSGTMDTELYEEPYSFMGGYEVSLTFSDLAVLNRKNFNRNGYIALRDLIAQSIEVAGLPYQRDRIEEHISTGATYHGYGSTLTKDVSFICDNFYDEEGIAMTWREVLDESLRPFALKLIQKGGQIIVYDINSLCEKLGSNTLLSQNIYWEGSDAVLGVDKVYNNVKINFNPYNRTQLLNSDVNQESVSGTERKIMTELDSDVVGFTIALNEKGKGLNICDEARYFRIDSLESGSDCAGVAWIVKTKNSSNVTYQSLIPNSLSQKLGNMLIQCPQQPYLVYPSIDRMNYQMRICVDVLADVRYNPFEKDGKKNEAGNYDEMQRWCNFTYIPIRLILRDDKGNSILHYQNIDVVNSKGYSRTGKWVEGEGEWGSAVLAWYDFDDREKKTGIGGWKTNKQCIGYVKSALPEKFKNRGDGEFIDLPPKGGWIDFQIGSHFLSYGDDGSNWRVADIHPDIRWLLYKSLKIDLVLKNGKTLNEQDVQFSAWLNRHAKEELSVDTILGTLKKRSPHALGQILRTSTSSTPDILNTFYRGGREDRLEHLLIGSLYSNYATRHNTLSGTARLLPVFSTYNDVNDKPVSGEHPHYMLLSETQNLRDEESSIKMVQISADNYEGIEFEDETNV